MPHLYNGMKKINIMKYPDGFQIETLGEVSGVDELIIFTVDKSGLGLKNETIGNWYWQLNQ